MNLENIRKEFPVTSEIIFFDHARVAPLPKRVKQVVTAFIDDATRFGAAITKTGFLSSNVLEKNSQNLSMPTETKLLLLKILRKESQS